VLKYDLNIWRDFFSELLSTFHAKLCNIFFREDQSVVGASGVTPVDRRAQSVSNALASLFYSYLCSIKSKSN